MEDSEVIKLQLQYYDDIEEIVEQVDLALEEEKEEKEEEAIL